MVSRNFLSFDPLPSFMNLPIKSVGLHLDVNDHRGKCSGTIFSIYGLSTEECMPPDLDFNIF